MPIKKIKAGALQLTLFIVVLIALLLAGFILLTHTHQRFKVQAHFITETINNANKGINYTLVNKTQLNDTVQVDLKDESYKTLGVHREFWGLFEKVITTSKIKTNSFQKAALIGATQSETNRIALYSQENNKPLVLVGNTKIEGVAYLPKQGVRLGTIAGNSYYGSQLIYGPTRVSGSLPKLFNETDNHLKNIIKKRGNIMPNQYLNIEDGKNYTNSFLAPLQVVYSPNSIRLNAVNLTGHIVVQSQSKIIIDAFSSLIDVVLIAPEIEIQANVKGNFQAIASKQLSVGKNCRLNYPSALVLIEKDDFIENTGNQNEENNDLTIESGSEIKGVLVYLGNESNTNYKPNITIGENVTLYGEVYCNKNLELKGSVFGSVFTNNFIANQLGSIYQNHIYNATIEVNKLPEEYIGLPFNDSKKGVLKWLY